MKKLLYTILILICTNLVFAQEKPYRILNSFSAGELSELLNAREDLSKYHSGCSLMENMFPLPQGGAEKRPGTVYVAGSKNNTKVRLLPFEYSTEQSYIIELGNQYARFYTSNAAILGGTGTEDLSALDNIKAHWLLNDDAANTAVVDDDGATHDGVASANTEDVHTEGQVGTGAFDLDGQYAVSVTDHADFTFVEGTDGDFSITAWTYITEAGVDQVIASKWSEEDASEAREWKLLLDSTRKLKMCLADESLLLDSDLIAHWKLNDSAATSAIDDATGSHDGTLSDGDNDYTSDHSVAGAATNTVNAFNFVAPDDYISITNHTDFVISDASDEPISIVAWVYVTNQAASQVILSKWHGNNDTREWNLVVDSSEKIGWYCYDDVDDRQASRTTDAALSVGWHHIAMVYDNADASWSGATAMNFVTFYVDGSLVASTATNDALYSGMIDRGQEVRMGALANGTLDLTGKLDNMMFFNKAVSATEVTALYNGGDGIEELDAVYPYKTSDDALTTGWRYIAMTYEGEHASWSGATAANYITMYVDGAAIAATATNLSTYATMEDTTALPRIGAQYSSAGAIGKIWADKLDEIAIFNDKLSATEVASLYTATSPYEITTPYLTADLLELKYEQSADVLYITHPDYETRKLERYANDDWPLTVLAVENGPFRTQNTDVADTIAASATTGSITLTAVGHAPFISGTIAGHLPSGSAATSKSQTGALFKLVHPLATLDFVGSFTDADDYVDCSILYKGATWFLVTNGTWRGIIEVQRNYTTGAAWNAAGWETVLEYTSGTSNAAGTERNVDTTGTEDYDAASYQVIFTTDWGGTADIHFRTDQTEHVGVAKITAVASPTSATATVLTTLASTDATHKWSEGSWSNYRGWPQTVTFFEDRLTFGGNTSQPDTIWASVTADYENMLEGVDDDDALLFTLSSRQVNVIEWLVGKDRILIGTSGAEWTLGGSADEPLTPSNVKAEQHSTYGSTNLQAVLAGESVLFFQRGAEKMRELAYNWEADSYTAPDMTILNPEVTGDGITNMAFQQTPNSILWCVKENGDIATFVYERKEQITSWSKLITDDDFESVAIIHGAAEDQVWVSVARVIGGNTKRYIEYFSARDYGSSDSDAFYIDSGITDTGGSTTVSGLDHLEGETVIVLADGVVQTEATAGDFTVSSGNITVASGLTTVQAGLPYTVQLRTMPLSWVAQGVTIQGRIKRINEVTPRYYNSGDFDVGRDSTTKETLSIDGIATSEERITFPPGYDKPGYIFVYQQSPEPMTLLALMVEFMVY